jgi:hypothetical protein
MSIKNSIFLQVFTSIKTQKFAEKVKNCFKKHKKGFFLHFLTKKRHFYFFVMLSFGD